MRSHLNWQGRRSTLNGALNSAEPLLSLWYNLLFSEPWAPTNIICLVLEKSLRMSMAYTLHGNPSSCIETLWYEPAIALWAGKLGSLLTRLPPRGPGVTWPRPQWMVWRQPRPRGWVSSSCGAASPAAVGRPTSNKSYRPAATTRLAFSIAQKFAARSTYL